MGMINREIYKSHKLGQRVKPVLCCGPGLTKQEFREETDINGIMKRYNATGVLPVDMATVQPVFADVSDISDFASVLNRMIAARESFNSLDPVLRARFRNDPAELVEFLQDGRNRPEAVALGLISAPKEQVLPAEPAVVTTPNASSLK